MAHAQPTSSGDLRIELNLTSDPAKVADARKAVEALCERIGFDRAACDVVGLCVNEALANVIRHAYGGEPGRPIHVLAEGVMRGPVPKGADRDGVRIAIRDWGSGVNPAALPPKAPDPLTPGGLGLVCLREWMDEVDYVPQSDGMLLTMVKWR
ncbi:MAG: ATP-binding protein [Tepidisphaeraceae bacterium]